MAITDHKGPYRIIWAITDRKGPYGTSSSDENPNNLVKFLDFGKYLLQGHGSPFYTLSSLYEPGAMKIVLHHLKISAGLDELPPGSLRFVPDITVLFIVLLSAMAS